MKTELKLINDICHKYTFDAKKVREYVVKHCEKKTLNLFAGINVLAIDGVDETRIDLDNEMPDLDFCCSAEEFIASYIGDKFDTIIYDPPWNERKAKEFYEGRYIGRFQKLKAGIVKQLKLGGIIISAGYEISNFGKKRGFEVEKLLIINPYGEIRPYFISIERYVKQYTSIRDYFGDDDE